MIRNVILGSANNPQEHLDENRQKENLKEILSVSDPIFNHNSA